MMISGDIGIKTRQLATKEIGTMNTSFLFLLLTAFDYSVEIQEIKARTSVVRDEGRLHLQRLSLFQVELIKLNSAIRHASPQLPVVMKKVSGSTREQIMLQEVIASEDLSMLLQTMERIQTAIASGMDVTSHFPLMNDKWETDGQIITEQLSEMRQKLEGILGESQKARRQFLDDARASSRLQWIREAESVSAELDLVRALREIRSTFLKLLRHSQTDYVAIGFMAAVLPLVEMEAQRSPRAMEELKALQAWMDGEVRERLFRSKSYHVAEPMFEGEDQRDVESETEEWVRDGNEVDIQPAIRWMGEFKISGEDYFETALPERLESLQKHTIPSGEKLAEKVKDHIKEIVGELKDGNSDLNSDIRHFHDRILEAREHSYRRKERERVDEVLKHTRDLRATMNLLSENITQIETTNRSLQTSALELAKKFNSQLKAYEGPRIGPASLGLMSESEFRSLQSARYAPLARSLALPGSLGLSLLVGNATASLTKGGLSVSALLLRIYESMQVRLAMLISNLGVNNYKAVIEGAETALSSLSNGDGGSPPNTPAKANVWLLLKSFEELQNACHKLRPHLERLEINYY